MFENGYAERRGIVSFITASSYLRGPGFAGMRQRMREAFDELWILDLEGGQNGARKTENVFAIKTPVCIATGIRHAAKKKTPLAKVRYACITGTREEKLAKLKAIGGFGDVAWDDCFDGATEPLLPKRVGNFSRGRCSRICGRGSTRAVKSNAVGRLVKPGKFSPSVGARSSPRPRRKKPPHFRNA